MDTNLVAKVEQRIIEQKLIDSGDVVVIAVSGGSDSVALLHVLFTLSRRYGWKLVVAHVNHRFRGAESDEEANFVVALAARLELPCEIGDIDVPAYIEETSMNGQAAAREKRYAFLHEVADKHQAQCIAFAHHADDQAETVMMRLLRGTGPSGLVGMPERRLEKKVELIRPFLRIYKSELVQYCAEHEIAYCQDSSNALRKYFRNQVRLDVLPMLKQYNEQFSESLNRLTELMCEEDDYLEKETLQVFKRIVTKCHEMYRLERASFTELHVALQRRLIKLILNCLCLGMDRLDFTKVESIRELILKQRASNHVLEVDEQLYIVREYEAVHFQSFAPSLRPYQYQVELSASEMSLPEADIKLVYSLIYSASTLASVHSLTAMDVYLDLDQLELPLSIRSRKPGDRLEPHGLNGSKKVKDMFIDAKMPLSRREVIPLLVDASGQVLWIVGFRRSKHALVGPDTKHVLHMKLMLK
ncbi:tRNA lysidine(34) synthetase TilS [Paenibacillus sp. SYP-B3998]|uniref:tRNA(Ile)-lysidine synthase n=1 Tax=Paenibacillus sp. SYP-B3998 TaxID=2678564 RepID=A0A6G4A5L1_9BACL|nr:tRNA lysidine(34) synthetase TilS [Paenibacillus sp. SYP-B3998]NEW09578.1 tRNA lysidine(34) synthetase TilS [Paenibacillus sp. SYP-B3998]